MTQFSFHEAWLHQGFNPKFINIVLFFSDIEFDSVTNPFERKLYKNYESPVKLV